jgi:hypothetical protein
MPIYLYLYPNGEGCLQYGHQTKYFFHDKRTRDIAYKKALKQQTAIKLSKLKKRI